MTRVRAAVASIGLVAWVAVFGGLALLLSRVLP